MNRSIWTIVTMGIMTLAVMTFMMLFSLTKYGGTEAGNRARLTNQVRESFGFPEVAAGVKEGAQGQKILKVEYIAHTDSNLDEGFMDAEMRRVAAFAQHRYDGRDRGSISSLRVRRLEVRGSGCWQTTLDRDLVIDGRLGNPRPPNEPAREDPEEEKKEPEENP
jgi:hypothetical protein